VQFARHLPSDDYDLVVCSLSTIAGNRIESELQANGIRVVNLGAKSLRDIAAFRRLLRLVREEHFEIVHAHLTYASIWASLVSRITGVPSIATLHVAPPSAGRDVVRDLLLSFTLSRWSARIVAVSNALREEYGRRRRIASHRIVTLHNGIDIDRFERDRNLCRHAITADFGVPLHERLVVTVSVLRPGKGIEVLLEAARRTANAHYLIIGDGPMRHEWTDLARQLGVSSRIHWAGHCTDVGRYLAGADLMVHPSLADAFPTVLLEAMAAGLPVIASDVGGVPEIVDHDVTGFLVAPGDADQLASRAAELLRDRDRSLAMGERGRNVVKQRFSTTAWIERLSRLYRDVLSQPRADRRQ
jgi:glycosyltransferase involved in cell wall biosynthesis